MVNFSFGGSKRKTPLLSKPMPPSCSSRVRSCGDGGDAIIILGQPFGHQRAAEVGGGRLRQGDAGRGIGDDGERILRQVLVAITHHDGDGARQLVFCRKHTVAGVEMRGVASASGFPVLSSTWRDGFPGARNAEREERLVRHGKAVGTGKALLHRRGGEENGRLPRIARRLQPGIKVSGTGAAAGATWAASRMFEVSEPGPRTSATRAISSTGTRSAMGSNLAQDERGGDSLILSRARAAALVFFPDGNRSGDRGFRRRAVAAGRERTVGDSGGLLHAAHGLAAARPDQPEQPPQRNEERNTPARPPE